MGNVAKWTGVVVVVIVVAMFLHWNEHDSPWGKATQEYKVELLKATVCK